MITTFLAFIVAQTVSPIVVPNSLVMGQGGKIVIPGQYPEGTTVSMDNILLPVTRSIDGNLTATIKARKFWAGPKRLIISNGTTIDGQFQLTELRPFGTEIIINDFEQPPTVIGGKNYYRGTAQAHFVYGTGAPSSIIVDPTTGSKVYRQMLTSDGETSLNSTWLADAGVTSYTEPDGTRRSGRGLYIPEAVGMNRLRYEIRGAETGENSTGTYHSNPEVATTPETNNWHFYTMWRFTTANQWKLHLDPLFYTNQRQSGGCCSGVGLFGTAGTIPLAYKRGEVAAVSKLTWNRSRMFVIPFDTFTRFYLDVNRSLNGEIAIDNLGFASVDQGIKQDITWQIQDALSNTKKIFSFQVTNTRDIVRLFHTTSLFVGTRNGIYNYFVSPNGLYIDVNKDGQLDSGDTWVDANPGKSPKIGFNANETKHFLLSMTSSTAADIYQGVVAFNEANLPPEESAYSLMPRYSPIRSPMATNAAYFHFTGFVNTVGGLTPVVPTTPVNASAKEVNGETWINWNDPIEAVNGTLSKYEIEKGTETIRVLAASPGYIDSDTGKSYRVRSISTTGDTSEWTASITAGDTEPPIPIVVPNVTLSPSSITVSEGGSTVVNITLSELTTVPVVVTLSYSDSDATISGNVIEFSPGEITKELPVTIIDDLIEEDEEILTISVANVAGGTDTSSPIMITIPKNDYWISANLDQPIDWSRSDLRVRNGAIETRVNE